MISIICFEKDLVIPREEAKTLGLRHTENPRIGIHNNEVQTMRSYDYYKSDCIEKDGKYYIDQKHLEEDKAESSSYLYDKVPNPENYAYIERENHLVDLLSFASKCKHKFYIVESVKSEEPNISNIREILSVLEEKATNLNNLVDKIKSNTFNEKVNVHVGGGLITTYNDLALKENACTDELQSELNNGWRIIAVCVQPDQRRPDYILGRYNPKLDVVDKPDAGR